MVRALTIAAGLICISIGVLCALSALIALEEASPAVGPITRKRNARLYRRAALLAPPSVGAFALGFALLAYSI